MSHRELFPKERERERTGNSFQGRKRERERERERERTGNSFQGRKRERERERERENRELFSREKDREREREREQGILFKGGREREQTVESEEDSSQSSKSLSIYSKRNSVNEEFWSRSTWLPGKILQFISLTSFMIEIGNCRVIKRYK